MMRLVLAALACAAVLPPLAAAASGAEPRDLPAIVGGAPRAGYVLEGSSGVLTLDELTWETDRRALLARAGFRAAFQRFWSAGPRSATGFAAVFRTAAGAHAGIPAVYDVKATGGTVTRVGVHGLGDEARGYRIRAKDGVRHVLVWRRGNVVAVAALRGAGAREASELRAYSRGIDRRARARLR